MSEPEEYADVVEMLQGDNMSEPELLTTEEMRVIYCNTKYASAVDAWEAIAQAQLAKCKEQFDKELPQIINETQLNERNAGRDHYESVIIPARIAEAVKKTRDELINADNYIKIFLEWKATEIRAEERARWIKEIEKYIMFNKQCGFGYCPFLDGTEKHCHYATIDYYGCQYYKWQSIKERK